MKHLLGVDLPIIQAPMAGAQGSALAVAVSNAGGLGSLPCALLGLEDMRRELAAITAQTTKPFNVNFFCHAPPEVDPAREAAWRAALAPYFAEYGIDASAIPAGAGRSPFSAEAADLIAEFRPAVVSFHFGLPPEPLLARVRAWGRKNPLLGDDGRRGAVAGGPWGRRGHRPGDRGGWPPGQLPVRRPHRPARARWRWCRRSWTR